MAKSYSGGIEISTGFKLLSGQPIVDYMVVDNISDLNSSTILPYQFEGMFTYVKEDQNMYIKKATGWTIIAVTATVNNGLPSDFYISTTPNGTYVTYLTDSYRQLDLQTGITASIIDSYEVVRDNNDLFIICNYNTVDPSFIIKLAGCNIVENVLTFETKTWKYLPYNNIFGTVFHRDAIYMITRPPVTSDIPVLIKIKSDLSYTKTLAFPNQTEFLGRSNSIVGYKGNIYLLFAVGGSAYGYFTKVDENLNTYEIVFRTGDVLSSKPGYRTPFFIYNEEIYFATHNYTNSTSYYNYIGISVYNLGGRLLRSNSNIQLSTGATSAASVSWMTIFNGKIILATTGTAAINRGKLIRVDCYTLLLEEVTSNTSNSFSDDNTIFSNGDIYMNQNQSPGSKLLKYKYNNFLSPTTEIDNFNGGTGSNGSINVPVYQDGVIYKTSQLKNDGEDGTSIYTSKVYVDQAIADATGGTASITSDLPKDFFMSTFTGSNGQLHYITDTFRILYLADYVPEVELKNSNEILRDGNDIWVLYNQVVGPTNVIVRLVNCRIKNNILEFDDVFYKEFSTGLRTHGARLHRGFVFLTTRPDSTSVPTTLFKINAYNFDDEIKTLEFPSTTEYLGNTTDILTYKSDLFITFKGTGVTAPIYVVKITQDLQYEIAFSYAGDNTKRFRGDPPFAIYNDAYYILTYNNTNSSTAANFIGVSKIDINTGKVLLESVNQPVGTGLTYTPYPHWMQVFNGKLIAHTGTPSTSTSKLVLRFDINTLQIEESYPLPASITDDNTIMSTGLVYLNGEVTEPGGLYTFMYNDISGTFATVSTPYKSTGSIAYIHDTEGNIDRTSKLKNDGYDGVNPYITSVELGTFSNGLVPYTNANKDVLLGTFSIQGNESKFSTLKLNSGTGFGLSIYGNTQSISFKSDRYSAVSLSFINAATSSGTVSLYTPNTSGTIPLNISGRTASNNGYVSLSLNDLSTISGMANSPNGFYLTSGTAVSLSLTTNGLFNVSGIGQVNMNFNDTISLVSQNTINLYSKSISLSGTVSSGNIISYTNVATSSFGDNTLITKSYADSLIKNDLPPDFFAAGYYNISTTIGGMLFYISDTERTLDLTTFVPELSNVSSVQRNGNDLFIAYYTNDELSGPNPFAVLALYDCKLVNNILVVGKSDYVLLPEVITVGVTSPRLHCDYYSGGYLYYATRVSENTIPTQFFKINAYDLSDYKISTPFNGGYIGSIVVYNDYIYCMPIPSTPTGGTIVRINTDFTSGLETIATIGTIAGKRVRRGTPFLIVEDEIYLTTVDNTGSSLNTDTIGIQVYSISGTLIRENIGITLGSGATGQPVVHWMSLINNVLVLHTATSSANTLKKVFTIDSKTLLLKEVIEAPFRALTDDNTITRDGYVYLNPESSSISNVSNTLYRTHYTNLAGWVTYSSTGYFSAGSIDYSNYNLYSLRTKLSQFQNDIAIGTTTSWGGITGSIANQTDLQTALNNKLSATASHNVLNNKQGGDGIDQFYHLSLSQYNRVLDSIYISGTTSLSITPTTGERGFTVSQSLSYNIISNDDTYIGATVTDLGSVFANVNLGTQSSSMASLLNNKTYTLSTTYTRKGVTSSETRSVSYTSYIPQFSGATIATDYTTYSSMSTDLQKYIQSSAAISKEMTLVNQYVWFISNKNNATILDQNNFQQSVGVWDNGTSEFYSKSLVLTLSDNTTTATVYLYRSRTVKNLTNFTFKIQ